MEKRNNKSGAKCSLPLFSLFFPLLLSLFPLNRASSRPTKIHVSLKSLRPPGARLIASPIKYDGLFANREGSAEDFTHSAEIIMEFREMIYIAQVSETSPSQRDGETEEIQVIFQLL